MFKRLSVVMLTLSVISVMHMMPASAFEKDYSWDPPSVDFMMIDLDVFYAITLVPDIDYAIITHNYRMTTAHSGLISPRTKSNNAFLQIQKAVGIQYAWFG